MTLFSKNSFFGFLTLASLDLGYAEAPNQPLSITYDPQNPMATALDLVVGKVVGSTGIDSFPVRTGTFQLVTKQAVLITDAGADSGYKIVCTTKTNPFSRVPMEIFLGCSVSEVTDVNQLGLPLLSQKDLFLKALPDQE